MLLNVNQLAIVNKDCMSLTGKSAENFVCLITLQDDPNAELVNGHILNKSIRKTSRATVIQYKEIDNYFGTALEHGFVTAG